MSDSLASVDKYLKEVLEKKPPISASTTAELTKLATNLPNEFVPKLATKIQNFFRTCPKTYRLSALYLIDSICKSKGDSRKSYIEAFSQPLPGLLSVFLKDGDDKDEAAAKKLGRIWVEKRLFPDQVLSSIASVFSTEIGHIIPGSESLPPPQDSPQSFVDFSAAAPHPNTHLHPSQGSHISQHPAYPGQSPSQGPYPSSYATHGMPPAPAASGSLVDDLTSLGDLNALLGPPRPTAQQPPPHLPVPNFYPHATSRYGAPTGPPAQYPLHHNAYPAQPDYRQPGPQRFPMPNPSYPTPYGAPPPHDGSVPKSYGAPPHAQAFTPGAAPAPKEATPDAIPQGPIYSSTLFVASIASGTTENDLYGMFSKYGQMKRISYKPEKGFAFVPFSRRSDAEAAQAALDGYTLSGRNLAVRWARSDQYRNATVDPNTGLLSFDGAAGLSSSDSGRGNGNASPVRNNNHRQNRELSHGIPRGVRPQFESSFADEPSGHNGSGGGGGSYHRDHSEDGPRGKRRFEGEQPQGEKRRFDSNDGFEAMTSYSGR